MAVGTRLQDFTHRIMDGLCGGRASDRLNVGRHDCDEAPSFDRCGCKIGFDGAWREQLGDYRAPDSWTHSAQDEGRKWDNYVADNVAPGKRPNSYAQAIGVP